MAKTKLVDSVQDFYDSNSEQWSFKRSAPWVGWDMFWAKINDRFQNKKELNILDLGCGNGRLLEFYRENFSGQVNYLGLDISKQLLNVATGKGKELDNVDFEFTHQDLTKTGEVEKILHKSQRKYDVINLIAVLHHFPDQESRVDIIKLAGKYLADNGVLVYTTWEFLDDEKTRKLVVKELGEGDFFLSWGMKVNLKEKNIRIKQRFVHAFSEAEKKELIESSGVKLFSDFRADGKNGKLNHYFILSKIT